MWKETRENNNYLLKRELEWQEMKMLLFWLTKGTEKERKKEFRKKNGVEQGN